MRLKNALRIIDKEKDVLHQSYNVDSISIFGSTARDEAKPTSDVDILVEFNKVPGILGFMKLKTYLEKILSCPVDLVTKNALKKQFSESILKSSIRAA